MLNQNEVNVSPRMLGHLRRKLSGFEESLGRCVAEMADYENSKQGFPPKKVRGWIEVKPADPHDPLAAAVGIDWIAYLHARTWDGDMYSVPVVPDEFNPRPDKIVRPDDKPHVFHLMREAEDAANAELPGFISYIEAKI